MALFRLDCPTLRCWEVRPTFSPWESFSCWRRAMARRYSSGKCWACSAAVRCACATRRSASCDATPEGQGPGRCLLGGARPPPPPEAGTCPHPKLAGQNSHPWLSAGVCRCTNACLDGATIQHMLKYNRKRQTEWCTTSEILSLFRRICLHPPASTQYMLVYADGQYPPKSKLLVRDIISVSAIIFIHLHLPAKGDLYKQGICTRFFLETGPPWEGVQGPTFLGSIVVKKKKPSA